jgi:hypothetical protein
MNADTAAVILKLTKMLTPEEYVFFLNTSNPYIGGREPQELLDSDPERVLSLAQTFKHPADVF